VEYPPLTKEFTEDLVEVVIIGGGFTGLSAAYHILKESPGVNISLKKCHEIVLEILSQHDSCRMMYTDLSFRQVSMCWRVNELVMERLDVQVVF
jgi:hypothetical protein